jgi:hypothetical protein
MTNFPAYQTALFLHILGVLGFFIALGVSYTAVLGVRRAQTIQSIRLWTSATNGVNRILFPLSGLLILVAGIYMVQTEWSERAPWASVALIALFILAIGAPVTQGRRLAALRRSAAAQPESAPVTDALWAQAHDAVTWVSVNASAALAIGIVYLMTLKPDALGSVIALLIAPVVGMVFGFLTQGRSAAATALAPTPAPALTPGEMALHEAHPPHQGL